MYLLLYILEISLTFCAQQKDEDRVVVGESAEMRKICSIRSIARLQLVSDFYTMRFGYRAGKSEPTSGMSGKVGIGSRQPTSAQRPKKSRGRVAVTPETRLPTLFTLPTSLPH